MEAKKENDNSLYVGRVVWYKEFDRRAKSDDASLLRETTITKVGNKYFETEITYLGRFHKSTLIHDGRGYSGRGRIYLDKDAYLNEIEANKIYQEIRNHFSSYNNGMELSKLRQILELVKS
jgi:hypothetical protein